MVGLIRPSGQGVADDDGRVAVDRRGAASRRIHGVERRASSARRTPFTGVGYQPPECFCEAVLRCPPMGSMEYLQALLVNGGRDLVKATNPALV